MGFGVEELSQVTTEESFGTSLEGQSQERKHDEVMSKSNLYRTKGRCFRPILPPLSFAPHPDICVFPGVLIKAEVWARALMAIFYDDDGEVNLDSLLRAAKILFDSLVTENETRARHRHKAIKAAVSWMKQNKVDGVDPYAFFPLDNGEALTPQEVEKIHKLIFREE